MRAETIASSKSVALRSIIAFQQAKSITVYINPKRDVPAEAEAVHGLSTTFLRDKPLFDAVADAFLEFIKDDVLVIHNAPFDIGFLNAELGRLAKTCARNGIASLTPCSWRDESTPPARTILMPCVSAMASDNSKTHQAWRVNGFASARRRIC